MDGRKVALTWSDGSTEHFTHYYGPGLMNQLNERQWLEFWWEFDNQWHSVLVNVRWVKSIGGVDDER